MESAAVSNAAAAAAAGAATAAAPSAPSGGGAGGESSQSAATAISVPEIFLCPITTELMRDPVSTIDGLTYERSAITQWLRTNNTSPLTGAVLESDLLIPCVLVRGQIQDLLERHPELNEQ